MVRHDQQPLWDSPWFWGLLFSGISLVALELANFKYGSRQAQLELQHQGRAWAQLEEQGASSPGFAFSTPESTEIGLGPLRSMALIGLLATTGGLVCSRTRRRPNTDVGDSTPEGARKD